MSFYVQIIQVVSVHIEEYDIILSVENDDVGKKLQQHVTLNGNPH